jgi:nucleotide-binding universal stress UspA family protein
VAINHIVLALDGSSESARATPVAQELTKCIDAPVTVVHVREMMLVPEAGGRPRNINEEEVTGRITQQVADMVNDGVHADLRIVESTYRGGPAHEIVQVAQELSAGLIVAGARGYGMITGLLVGSVAHRLPFISTCPVLIVPPAAAG